MDITSVEFYTLAFVVAMALVGLLMGRREKNAPSTYIVPLVTSAAGDDESEDALSLEAIDGGILFNRTGIHAVPQSTVHLVINIEGDHCSIVEKQGRKSKGRALDTMNGTALVKCLAAGRKYHVRYESQLNSTWATFTVDTASPGDHVVKLNY